ncbi:hypothetical protein [Vibrio splendidus]|uniref:hypothetical protein n=1 Tax=Vibrio splendidus TaxID=29497 RepID=UPI003D098131
MKWIPLLMGALVLAGCASQEYKDNLKANQAVHQAIADKSTFTEKAKVTRIRKPPQSFARLTPPQGHEWMKEVITVNVNDMPLSVVLEEIMAGVDTPLFFGEGVDPNHAVTLNYSSARENVLNLLSRDVGYSIEQRAGRLEVSATVTRTFSLNIPTGKMYGQLGSQGSQTKGEATIEGQYLNVKYSEVDITTEVANDIKSLLGGGDKADEAVSASVNLSSITVTATPDQMQNVETLIAHYQAELSKQVVLDVRVLEFRSNLGTERGVDWNVVRDTGSGLVKFFVPGTNTVSKQAGYGVAFQGTGKWSGTEALIKVLEKQGSVSTQTPITAMVLNNQPARITQQTLEPYIYEASSESSEGVVSASVTRREEVEGVDFMATANVQPEYVWLRLSGQLQKITGRESKSVENIELGFLTKQKSEITFANKLRYGQTYVIASVKQNSRLAEKTKNFWSDWLGGTGSQNTSVETLVLLTPRKVK